MLLNKIDYQPKFVHALFPGIHFKLRILHAINDMFQPAGDACVIPTDLPLNSVGIFGTVAMSVLHLLTKLSFSCEMSLKLLVQLRQLFDRLLKLQRSQFRF